MIRNENPTAAEIATAEANINTIPAITGDRYAIISVTGNVFSNGARILKEEITATRYIAVYGEGVASETYTLSHNGKAINMYERSAIECRKGLTALAPNEIPKLFPVRTIIDYM